MKKGNLLIVVGVVVFLTSLFLIRWSSIEVDKPTRERQSVVSYPAPVPSPLMIQFPSQVLCGLNLTGSFVNYTQGEPIVEVLDPQGILVFSRSAFPPPSVIEFDSNAAGFYSIYFNLVFGQGGGVEIYYYVESTEIVRPNGWAFLPAVFGGVVGVAVAAVGAFVSYRESEEEERSFRKGSKKKTDRRVKAIIAH